jgi:hydrogenase nickel incorporation protein HypA/HybF
MHELGMCEAILDTVERRAAGRRVSAFTVRVGTLHRVVEPAMDQAFALASEGTLAEGAELHLVVLPVRGTCRSCGLTTESAEPPVACAGCGATDLELSGGDELILESIEVDAPLRMERSADVPGHTR